MSHRIAYMFNGHLRTFRQNRSIVPMLLERNPGDVFVQTFCVRNLAGNKWHGDEGGANEPVTMDDLDALDAWLPNIVAVEVSPIKSGAEALHPRHAGVGFRWAKQRVCEMRRAHEKAVGVSYDIVFIARYDLGFHEPVDLSEGVEPGVLYGGYNANQERQGNVGDVFLYGTPEVIDNVMMPAVPHELADEAARIGYLGERLVTRAMERHGYRYEAHRVRHFLYRSGGAITEITHE